MATVGMHRTHRVRCIPTAKVCKQSQGISRRHFFILSTVPDPLSCKNMSKHFKTIGISYLRNIGQDNGRYVLSESNFRLSLFVQSLGKARAPAFRFNTYNVYLAYTVSEMELNRFLFLYFERKCLRCERHLFLITNLMSA